MTVVVGDTGEGLPLADRLRRPARAAGRLKTDIGAHVVDRNRGTIGLWLIGGHGADADDTFDEHFTLAQARSLRTLIADIRGRTQTTKVTGHKTYAAKACPGFRVEGWI